MVLPVVRGDDGLALDLLSRLGEPRHHGLDEQGQVGRDLRADTGYGAGRGEGELAHEVVDV